MDKLEWFVFGVTIFLIAAIYISSPTGLLNILGILLGVSSGFFMSLHLQQKITKKERKQRRCSEILVPLYTKVEKTIQELKYGHPKNVGEGLFEDIRSKELYILSSGKFKQKIDKFIETMNNYVTFLYNSDNHIQNIIAEAVMEGYNKYELDKKDKKSFDKGYFLKWATTSHNRINQPLKIVLKHDSSSELREEDKNFLKTELYSLLIERISDLYPDKNDSERWDMINEVSEYINNTFLNSLFGSTYFKETRQRKKTLENESIALKNYLQEEINEFKID